MDPHDTSTTLTTTPGRYVGLGQGAAQGSVCGEPGSVCGMKTVTANAAHEACSGMGLRLCTVRGPFRSAEIVP